MTPRSGARLRGRHGFAALPIAVVAIAAYAFWTPFASGRSPATPAGRAAGAPLAIAFRERMPALKALLEAPTPIPPSAPRTTRRQKPPVLTRRVAGSRPLRVMVVGSSVAATFSLGLERWAAEHNVQVLDEARYWCALGRGLPITQGIVAHDPGSCSDWPTRWSGAIRVFDPDVVLVFFSMWEVAPRQLPGSTAWLQPEAAPLDTWQLSEYQAAADVLSARGAAVDWLTIPCENAPTAVGSPLWHVNRRTVPALAASRSAVHVIDLDQEICRNGVSRDYAGVRDARPDGAHFSRAGAYAVAKWLMAVVLGDRPNPEPIGEPNPGARSLIRRAS